MKVLDHGYVTRSKGVTAKQKVALVWRGTNRKGDANMWLCRLFDEGDPAIRDFALSTGAYESAFVARVESTDAGAPCVRVREMEDAIRDLVTDCGDRTCECCRASAPMRARYARLCLE